MVNIVNRELKWKDLCFDFTVDKIDFKGCSDQNIKYNAELIIVNSN